MTRESERGFTVLELILAIIFLLAAGTVFFVQKRDLEVQARDSARKTAINELFYNLEDVYYPAHHAYPKTLTADQLPGIDPSVLKDPEGVAVGTQNSDYSYTPKDCSGSVCASYALSATMEQEANYEKVSRNQ